MHFKVQHIIAYAKALMDENSQDGFRALIAKAKQFSSHVNERDKGQFTRQILAVLTDEWQTLRIITAMLPPQRITPLYLRGILNDMVADQMIDSQLGQLPSRPTDSPDVDPRIRPTRFYKRRS